ncbi:HK97-gp10 family putative phage morphogenesis protein [Atopobiaceae bacterium LCP21S3_F11]|jgi:HK97 gp10 family phage protein|uniref:HK97-gp10 family putative phage morphogenesis protein n=1 Tax=Bacillati TaxID=1783272 RepID=UPI003F89479F
MSITVSGARELQQACTDASGRIDKETIAVLRRAAVRVRKRQKQTAPRDTGALVKAIGYRIRGTRWTRTAEIGPRMAKMYPVYQEYGTARMPASPFVRASVDGEEDLIADDLDQVVSRSYR